MKTVKLLTILVMFLFAAETAMAADYYVRAGAAGATNGADWSNAYTTLPAVLERGSTYYIADGSYGGYSFNDPVSGSSVITVKKATIADHGTDTGWQNTYGDGQAVFGLLTFTTSYWVFDGQTRNENNWKDQGAYGFVVTSTFADHTRMFNVTGASNITIRYVHGYYPEVCTTSECLLNCGLYSSSTSANITLERSLLRNFSWYAVFKLDNLPGPITLKYNYIQNAFRKEGISARNTDNVTVAHNIWENVAGTGAIVFDDANNWKIYNNVFYSPNTSYTFTDGIITTWTSKGQQANNVLIYGNTFSQMNGAKRIGSDGGTGNEVTNNIFHGFTATFSNFKNTSNENNAGDMFVNYKAGDFRLARETFSGVALPSPYNVDLTGNLRGASGSWDIGAFEFNGLSVGSSRPSAPSNLNIAP